MPEEPVNVECAKCQTESPRGTDNCPNCGSLLKGHSNSFAKHPENINTGDLAQQKRETKAREMLKRDGLDWDDLDGTARMLTLAAVSTKATAADRKAYTQNVSERLKPAPKIGNEMDVAIENVVIEAEQIENAVEALEHLKKFTRRQKKRKRG